jgi:hypothetical protein
MSSTNRAVSLLLLSLAACARTSPAPAPAPAAPATVVVAPAPRPMPAPELVTVRGLPERLSDSAFWKLVGDISEPGGYFRIEDNYTSNEMEIGQLYSMLRAEHVTGGVYVGVGPEQNFTYIAAIHPRMAFVVDIRRQAVMQHLMFKAMFEMAKDRADFISILFAKPRPAGIDTAISIQKLWDAYWNVASDSLASRRNYAAIVNRLTKTHGFTFTPDESAQLKSVFDAFYYFGPVITTRGFASGRGGNSGFADLTGYSPDAAGQPRSFLATESDYQYVKQLHEKNLIVPVSGDFAGPKAVRAIGAYLADHDGKMSAFYVSNVEQYLFMDGKAQAFYDNVGTMPVDSASVFIRPYTMRRNYGGGGPTRSLCPIAAFLRAAQAGRVGNNDLALACPI